MKKTYTLLYYIADNNLWYWKLFASGKKIIATGFIGYENKTNLLKSVKRMKVLNFEHILVRELVKVDYGFFGSDINI